MTLEEIKKEEERVNKMRQQNEKMLLKDFLKNNNISEKSKKDGIYFIVKKRGYGKKPLPGDSVIVQYVGRLINNRIFESTYLKNEPFKFICTDSNLIPGWNIAISYMHEGEEAIAIIPSNLAYGKKGISEIIPPYSTLVFDITMVKVKRNKH